MMLRLVVADDEPFSLRRLLFVLKQVPDVEVVGHATNGKAALGAIQQAKPDLAILDIEMPGLNGLELATVLGATGPKVIFVTAFAQHAPEAFAVEAVDYILKPFKQERLLQAIQRARKRLMIGSQLEEARTDSSAIPDKPSSGPPLEIVTKDGSVMLPQSDILWIEAEKDYVLVHTSTRTYIRRSTMTELSAFLAPGITRVHRSAYVALPAIHRTIRSPKGLLTLVLIDGTEVPVGPSYTQGLKKLLFGSPNSSG